MYNIGSVWKIYTFTLIIKYSIGDEELTIYVDVVLLENLCMNYIILFGTGYIIKIKIKHLRILASSTVGAVYAILAYAGIFPLYANVLVKIILSVCMVYIAFAPKNLKGIIKELIVFYLVSFALGGCAFALLYVIRPQDIFIKDGVFIGTYPIKIALLGGILGLAITYIAFKVTKTRMSKNELIYDIQIRINEKELTTKVMLDTGNMLKDPISNNPVILIEKNKLYEILPKDLLDSTKNILGGDFKFDNELENEYRTKLRIIPFTSVGKQNGMMIGIKADEVKIVTDVDEIINNEAIICMYEKEFSKRGRYSGLIGMDMLEVKESKEKIEK